LPGMRTQQSRDVSEGITTKHEHTKSPCASFPPQPSKKIAHVRMRQFVAP
jgi:hypothetical protein